MLRAVLASRMSHGITGQSTLAVREAADCRSDFLHAVIAGLSVGAGRYHQGALKEAMLEIQYLKNLSETQIEQYIDKRLSDGEKIMGFGHRFHKSDPRAEVLVEIAGEEQFIGPYLKTALLIEKVLFDRKKIKMNIDAAGGAILLDLGFMPEIAHMFIIIGRTSMWAAVYLERLAERLPPFPKIEVSDVCTDHRHDPFA
jgi:citrate synthase